MDWSVEALSKSPLKLDDLLEVSRRMLDQQIDIRVGKVLSGGSGAEENGETDAVLGAQRATQSAQQRPLPPQVDLLAVRQTQFPPPVALPAQQTLAGVTPERALVAMKCFGSLGKSTAYVSRLYYLCVQIEPDADRESPATAGYFCSRVATRRIRTSREADGVTLPVA